MTFRGVAIQLARSYNDVYYRDIRDGNREKLHEQKILFLTLNSDNFMITQIYEPEDKIRSVGKDDMMFFLQIPYVRKE